MKADELRKELMKIYAQHTEVLVKQTSLWLDEVNKYFEQSQSSQMVNWDRFLKVMNELRMAYIFLGCREEGKE